MRNLFAQTRAVLAAVALLAAAPAFADGPGDVGADVGAPVRAAPVPTAEPAASVTAPVGQSGQVSLLNGQLMLNVPNGYRFYPAEAAYDYLQRTNSVAPSGTVLGLLAPANARIDRAGTWASVVSYDPVGYVASDSAGLLADSNLEASVRQARDQQSRPFEGFAAPPAFDANSAGLSWAERTAAAGGASGVDYRNEQRILGRQGVAGLTSIGSADQMEAINAALPDMIGTISFPEGQTYGDFQSASDAVSNYTMPALVTGVAPVEPQAVAASTDGAQQSGVGGLAGMFPWIAGGVVVLAGAGYLLMRRRRDPNLDPEEEEA